VSLPPVLVFYVERFRKTSTGDRYTKNSSQLSFPLHIDLRNWLLRHGSSIASHDCDPSVASARVKTTEFELFGVVVHFGDNRERGHYFAFVKREKHWIKVSDESTEIAPIQDVLAAEASMLFYRRNKELKSDQS